MTRFFGSISLDFYTDGERRLAAALAKHDWSKWDGRLTVELHNDSKPGFIQQWWIEIHGNRYFDVYEAIAALEAHLYRVFADKTTYWRGMLSEIQDLNHDDKPYYRKWEPRI